MNDVQNARISSTMLGAEDHGILTAMLYLDYGNAGQGFGGYAMDRYNAIAKRREGHAYGSAFIRCVLDTLEIGSWEKLPGTHCRVRSTHSKVQAIGHIIKDKWFDPESDLAYLNERDK